MNRALIRMVVWMVFLTAAVKMAPAANPPFRQCSPSGYNCTLLITLDRKGKLTVDRDPNQPYYPPSGVNAGQLIGFQNNSNSRIYALHIESYDTSSVCVPLGFSGGLIAANVRVVNIPWGPNIGPGTDSYPYYFYTLAVFQPTTLWATSCDVVFDVGIPKGGSTYWTLDGQPNFEHWIATLPNVVALVNFQTTLAKGATADATVTLYPPNPVTVTLNLAPTNGTGSAVFTSTNSPTMTVTQSGPVSVKGVEASSVNRNLELSASVGGSIKGRATFTVIDTNISGRDTVWWFNGATPAGYDTQVTLTSSPGSTISWSIVAGSDKVSLSSNGNQATIRSTGSHFSGAPGDISIKVDVDGVASNPFTMTSRRPWKLVPRIPLLQTQCFFTPTNYVTTATYDLHDQLDSLMSIDAEWNEVLGTPLSENGSNWGSFGGPNPMGAATNPFEDMIGAPDANVNPTMTPLPTCSGENAGTTRYMVVPQTIRVGTNTGGGGVEVQQDTLGYYIDHGQHDDVQVPPPPQ